MEFDIHVPRLARRLHRGKREGACLWSGSKVLALLEIVAYATIPMVPHGAYPENIIREAVHAQ